MFIEKYLRMTKDCPQNILKRTTRAAGRVSMTETAGRDMHLNLRKSESICEQVVYTSSSSGILSFTLDRNSSERGLGGGSGNAHTSGPLSVGNSIPYAIWLECIEHRIGRVYDASSTLWLASAFCCDNVPRRTLACGE